MRLPDQRVSYHTASNGLRMVCLHRPGSAVGFAGVDVYAGSRDESPEESGLAHFVEHTIFKGTRRRSSWHIINRMEAVGGELNAYTTKEETVVYTAFPGGNLARAAELVADLIADSQFPAAQIEREREVVADEIDSYLDSPSEAVFDDFEDLLFAGSSLGHNILGDRASLDTFDSATCRRYLARWYVPSNMVAFYAGPLRPERAFAVMERAFGILPPGEAPHAAGAVPVPVPFDVARSIGSHQSHTVMGARTCAFGSPERYTLGLLTNILGGPGMNSLLNVELREKRGLVYNVEASAGLFSDCGALAVYFGCDPADNARCMALVTDTVRRVADGYVTPLRLERAKKQYLGQMIVGSESLENRALGIARQTLLSGRAVSPAESAEAVHAVTAPDLAAMAASMLPLSRLTLG